MGFLWFVPFVSLMAVWNPMGFFDPMVLEKLFYSPFISESFSSTWAVWLSPPCQPWPSCACGSYLFSCLLSSVTMSRQRNDGSKRGNHSHTQTGRFAYIYLKFKPNVGKCFIPGAYGIGSMFGISCIYPHLRLIFLVNVGKYTIHWTEDAILTNEVCIYRDSRSPKHLVFLQSFCDVDFCVLFVCISKNQEISGEKKRQQPTNNPWGNEP